jgi:hypothetical protein
MNDELERKWMEAVVAYFNYYPGVPLQRLRKARKNLRQDS